MTILSQSKGKFLHAVALHQKVRIWLKGDTKRIQQCTEFQERPGENAEVLEVLRIEVLQTQGDLDGNFSY